MDGTTLHLVNGSKIVEALLRGSLSIGLGMLVCSQNVRYIVRHAVSRRARGQNTMCVQGRSFDCPLKDIRNHAMTMITRLFGPIVQSRRSSIGLDRTHQGQKYSKASSFSVRIQRAREEDRMTKRATLLDERRHGFAQRLC